MRESSSLRAIKIDLYIMLWHGTSIQLEGRVHRRKLSEVVLKLLQPLVIYQKGFVGNSLNNLHVCFQPNIPIWESPYLVRRQHRGKGLQ